MLRNRLTYKFLFLLMVFSSVMLIPVLLTVQVQVVKLTKAEEALELTPESVKIHENFINDLTDSLVGTLFYIFIISFIFALFTSKKLLMPARELYKGALNVKNGNLDFRLPVRTDDELGDVIKSFNEMVVALRQATEELRKKDLYVNAMLDPMWVVNEEDIVIDINPAFTQLLGYSRDEVIGTSVYQFLDEENENIMRYQLREKRDKGISSIYETSLISREGSPIPVLISGSPLLIDGVIKGKIGVLKDFREQTRLRNDLRESRDYLETIMDSIDDAILVIDRDYRIIMTNKSALAQAGAEALGGSCYSVLHNKQNPCYMEQEDCPVKRVIDTGKTCRIIHEHTVKPGIVRQYDMIASPLRDSDGRLMNVLMVMRDVTERQQYENEIAQKNKELVSMNTIANVLSNSIRTEDIFINAMDKLVEMINMDGSISYVFDDSGKELVCTYFKGIPEEFMKILGRVRIGEGIIGKSALTATLIATLDISREQFAERTALSHTGVKGCCCVPILGKEKPLGVFCLFSFKPRYFMPEEERILTAVGKMIGIAFENIKLYEKMREMYEFQRHRRIEEHKHLYSLSTKLTSSLDIHKVVESALNLIRDSFRADFVWLLKTDNSGNMVFGASTGGVSYRAGDMVYQNGLSFLEGYAVEKKSPAICQLILSESRFYLSEQIVDSGFKSVISLPLYVGDKLLGAFSIYYKIQKEFREEDIHFLNIISSILSVAIERAELYEKGSGRYNFTASKEESDI